MDDEADDRGRGRSPQPAFAASFFPAGFIDVLDRSLLHRLLSFGVSGLQRAAPFLFEVGDGAQGNRHLENGFANFLDAAFADVGVAAEIAQGGGQTWTNGMAPKSLGDQSVVEVATASTGAEVPLELGDDNGRL